MARVEAYTSDMDLFSVPPHDVGVSKILWEDYTPIGDYGKNSCFEFNIPNNGTAYVDMKKTRLYVELEIKKQTGTEDAPDIGPVVNSDQVGLVNLSLQSLFSQVDVKLQQTLVSGASQSLYSYKSYLDVLLMREEENTYETLESQLFFKDTARGINQADPRGDPPTNGGLVERADFTNGGQTVDMEGPLFTDIAQQDRPILNKVPINIKLWPNRDQFRLMSGTEDASFFVNISKVRLRVCHVHLTPKMLLEHSSMLERTPAIYPYTRSDLRVFSIPKGQQYHEIDDIFKTGLPDKAVIGLVSSKAFNGSYEENPYNFQHFYLNHIGLTLDGQSLPTPPLEPDFSTRKYVKAYTALSGGQDKAGRSDYINISREDFKSGFALYMFDISSYARRKGMVSSDLNGHARLVLKFARALTEPVTMIVYSQSAAQMTIDGVRNVTA
jgi:hypothetical protein